MHCNLLIILKIENVLGAKCAGDESTGSEMSRGRMTGGEKLGTKCWGRNIHKQLESRQTMILRYPHSHKSQGFKSDYLDS